MKSRWLKQFAAAVTSMILITLLASSSAWAGKLLDEMQVQDTCGTTYADKLASCTPFQCQKPSPMAMMMGFPYEKELKKVPLEQQRKMRKSMAAAEKKMAALSPKEREAMKAKMLSSLEIKGIDAQGQCLTSTMVGPSIRMDCALDATMLQKVSDFAKAEESSDHIRFATGLNSGNPWLEALQSGQCKSLTKDLDAGWISMDQMNRMAHIELNLSEHGKHVDGHIQILNTSDGKVLFNKNVETSQSTRRINLNPGTFDIKVVSKNPQLAPVWFRKIKLGETNVFKKDIEFYAITGTLKLTVNVDGKPSRAAVYMTDSETQKWVYGRISTFGNKPMFHFSPVSINLPESLTGRYDVFVAPAPGMGFKAPDQSKFRKFNLSIKNGETVEKIINFGQAPATGVPKGETIAKPMFPITDANGMEQDTDRPGGGDLGNVTIAEADPALCQKACRENAQCKAWTYVKPNTIQGPQTNCWLKANVPAAHKNSCCISGVKSESK